MNVLNVLEDKVALLREVRACGRSCLSGTLEWRRTDTLENDKTRLRQAGFVIDEEVEYISDFRDKRATWRKA